ncbi:MAG: hypothetical protein FWC82_01970 [Firmicutes bacterium]|nr:hypothetical protein [Bacillota bacterium]
MRSILLITIHGISAVFEKNRWCHKVAKIEMETISILMEYIWIIKAKSSP